MKSIKWPFATPSQVREKSRLYVDASHFNPDQKRIGETWILFAHNEAEGIYERVSTALRSAAAVVLIDQGSTDGTPYFAAEAGAVVIIQDPEQTEDIVLQKAIQVAERMTEKKYSIKVC